MRRDPSPEEAALGAAQAELAGAIQRTLQAGKMYFDAPLARSMPARDAYYDALQQQSEAERAFYEAKQSLTARAGPHTR